jgi:hypothetical protein
MTDPIIIKGKLYLELCLNTVWTYDKDDKYKILIDWLASMNLKEVTITLAEVLPEESKTEIRNQSLSPESEI